MSLAHRVLLWTILVSALAVNVAGYALNLYERFWWFDDALHFYTPFAITLLLAYLLHGVVLSGVREHAFIFVLTVASLGIAVGALWEIAEWIYDALVPINAILGKSDTMIDLVLDTLGSLLAGVLSVALLKNRETRASS
jgi:VanZ family protein